MEKQSNFEDPNQIKIDFDQENKIDQEDQKNEKSQKDIEKERDEIAEKYGIINLDLISYNKKEKKWYVDSFGQLMTPTNWRSRMDSLDKKKPGSYLKGQD